MGRELRKRAAEATLDRYPHGPGAGVDALASALERAGDAATVLLVEGVSDQIAVETLATRRDIDLHAERAVVVPINGAQAIGRFVDRFAADGRRLVGLCDVGERRWFEQAARRAGDSFAWFVCDRDLEDELIRATGRERIDAIVDEQGERSSFSAMQSQPHWRGQPVEAQFHRWLRAGARRNLRYARLLSESCEAPPPPLSRLLDAVRPPS